MADQNVLAECTDYFKGNTGFARTMQALWDKWRSYGRVAGVIEIPAPSDEEVRALEGFFGEPVLKKGRLRFQVRDFEQALEHTRFRGTGLKNLLEEYFGRPLVSKKEEEASLTVRKDLLFEKALRELEESAGPGRACMEEETEPYSSSLRTCMEDEAEPYPVSLRWLTALTPQKLWQLQQNAGSEEEALRLVRQTGRALSILENTDQTRGIRMAVLAMECTGDPHGFDRGTLSGNLLLGALPALHPEEEEKVELSPRLAAEEALERYIRCALRPDDLSSFTILYRILLYDGHGPVQAARDMAERREPLLVSLLNLRNVQTAVPVNRRVYVIENQMVFSQLCEDCPDASLICTSGQVRTASLMILDFLCKEDTEIYYSGDLDPEGICIADRLICRSKGKIRPWHMTARDYEICISAVELTEERIRELDRVLSPCLKEGADAVRRGRKAGYQEKLLKVMAEEINESFVPSCC